MFQVFRRQRYRTRWRNFLQDKRETSCDVVAIPSLEDLERWVLQKVSCRRSIKTRLPARRFITRLWKQRQAPASLIWGQSPPAALPSLPIAPPTTTACPLFELFLISLKLKSFFKLSKYAGDDLLPCVEEVFQALVPTLGHELWVMTERVRWWIHPAEMSFLCLASGVFQSKADAPLLWREPVGGLGIWPGCLLGQVFHVLLGGDVQTHWRDCFSGKAGGGAAAPAAWPWLEKQQMMERCMKLRLWNKIILIVSSSVIEEPCGDPCTEADCLHRRWRTSHSRHFTVTLVTLSFYF